uniref:NADH dehydrogenase subunit 3 n=1 Tax=Ophioleila elegans TaxID=1815333 RepID=UPI0023EF839F|nr:NADH dehydrogenase subunit 3 [Ophioleila elegans]WED07069.1 NADH dehydrogenase subunit 3 [Ophioleila elegans]
MYLINLFFLIIFIITSTLTLLGRILPTLNTTLNKIFPYECGFDPINSPRLPFSFRFFLISILFLIFDLEIALLLILPFAIPLNNSPLSIFPLIIFILILIIGLVYEWINGGLDWANT